MPFEGKVEVTYTKNGVQYLGEVNDDVMNAVTEHARNHLETQHPDLDVHGISYEPSEPDYLTDITSDNNPNEEIQIPQLSRPIGDDTYVATFGLLEFTNQNGGRRRHKSRSRRAKKTAKRRLQRKHNLKRKTHRSKRKLHRK